MFLQTKTKECSSKSPLRKKNKKLCQTAETNLILIYLNTFILFVIAFRNKGIRVILDAIALSKQLKQMMKLDFFFEIHFILY